MDFEPLTPPGSHCGPDMTLVLSSTPNSFVGMKGSPQKFCLDQESEPVRLFNVNKHSDLEKSGSGPSFNRLPSPLSICKTSPKMETPITGNKELNNMEEEMSEQEDDDDEPIICDDCNTDFPSLQQFLDHKCTKLDGSNKSNMIREYCRTPSNASELSEGESFDGRIVYNPDGSAYILEDGDSSLSDLDSLIGVSNQRELIVDKKGSDTVSQVPALPQIANAIFVPRNPSYDPSREYLSQAPMMFSYKVYDMRSGKSENDEKSTKTDGDSLSTSEESQDLTNVPTKPILMCFICKLSFGYRKSFMAHAVSEHSMILNEDEKRVMLRKNSSAIIQCVGTKKEPLMSFLKPKALKNPTTGRDMLLSESVTLPNSFKSSLNDNTKVSFVHSKPKLSDALVLNSVSKSENSDMSQGSSMPYHYGASSITTCVHSSMSPVSSSLSSTAIENLTSNLRSKLSRQLDSPSASSPVPSMSPITNSTLFLGICDEHPQGRVQGVECPKCDMILGSSQSLGGHMTMMHSRNSCKTLKCPKCNWHYKYQETLEIHMKEKHPEGDQQCIYCLSNQAHPRLARGESYSCGYKPYRCEVCNYSTTTKGNLSIHMQSDKHLNNVQDLANGGGELKLQAPPQQQQLQQQQQQQQSQQQVQEQTPQQQSLPSINDAQLKKNNKPKPTWRCDVCNYETNVARNLRIHMTSEKHTHNMMVLQQNMKHMQRDMHIQQMNQLMLLQNDPAFITGYPSSIPASNMPFNIEQSLYGNAVPSSYGEIPMDLRKENGGVGVSFDPQTPDSFRLYNCCVCNLYVTDSLESLHQHLQVDRTKQRESETISISQGTYICNLCSYKTNLKANFQLHCKTDKHLQRLQLVNHIKEGGSNNEWRLKYLNVSNPVQVRCNSCDYYTNSIHKLQIHSGNPRHEKNSQLFHFLQLGESKIKSKSKYYHCTLCNFSTRAKLNMIQHVRAMKHLHNEQIKQLQMKEQGVTDIDPGEIFQVVEYNESEEDQIKFDEEDGELDDEDTVTSSYENDIQDKFDHPTTSKENTPESFDRTKTPTESKEDQIHVCPYCNYSSVNEMRIQAHVISQHSQNDSKILCPLCQEDFKEKRGLEKHLMNTHSVKPEGLQRLLLMVDQGDWMMPPTSIPTVTPFMPIDESGEINTEALEAEAARLAAEEAIDTAAVPDKNDADDQYRCQTCSKTFINIDGLYAHQNELGHLELKQTPRGPGYLCWKKGCNQYFKTAQALQVHFREIHAKRQPNITDHSSYKYECNQCSLAFKSPDKLQLHSHFHLIQSATRCSFCSRSFRSIAALRKHIDTGHSEISDIEKEQYHASMNVASMALGAVLKQSGVENLSDIISTNSEGSTTIVNAVKTPVTSAVQAEKLLAKTDMNSNETVGKVDESMDTDNSSLIENDDEDECMDTNEKEDAGDMPYKEQQFLEDYINSQAIAENSYEDPSRKFKCHRCRLAFTKQNYLTAHNKTLLHRRGDKMSYPMEKYLDPNRPFKCDVCKESFTQKNILLVHYNSVSHLHKLKQITQGSPSSMSTQQAESSDSELINTTSTSTIVNGESDKLKPYKCNICKVSYSQGTTLDIHIRSVSHQNKASKLQELVLTGQVDIMQPLIEQPSDPQMSQQQKMLSEIIAQQSSAFNQSMLFSGMPGFGDFGQFPMTTGLPLLLPKMSIPETVTTASTSTKSSTVIKSERIDSKFGISEQEEMNGLHMLAQAAANNDIVKKELAELVKDSPSVVGPTYLCQLCNAVFTNQDSLQQHQIMCMYQAGMTTPATHMRPKSLMGRVSSQVHRNLLENIGFECVMQFNEFNNQPASMREEALDKAETEIEIKKEIKEEKDNESEKKEDLPELNKGVCPTCHKEFSSVWVLKAHQEEVHKEVVPTIFVEDFGEQFKNDMDIKQAKESDSLQLCALNDPAIKEGSVKDMPPPPAPPPPPPLMSPQVDMSQMMPMYGMHLPMPLNMAMMNMQPQLMPMMFPVSTHDGMTSPMGVGDAGLQSLQNSQSKMPSGQQAAAVAAMQNQNKRARTRINDEQLKVLRAYFDINNSPSEEQINAMSEQSGLPTKVIKHWFRNTLFKERQRNKDSPYNFNNPPLTTLDLEEYEKTGKITSSDDSHEIVIKKEVDIMEEPSVGRISEKEELPPLTQTKPNPSPIVSLHLTAPISSLKLEPPPKTESPKSQDTMMDDSDSMSNSSGPLAASSFSAPPPLVNINMSTALSFTSNAEEIRPRFEFSPHHSAYNKRANRTRFTDYQIKVLQEYFEQNAYPKDDELDHLSKILNLSPRVIVVWFQNARQKARKIYENQPNPEVAAKETSSNSPFNRTAGLNYQCKKCTAVFQRYYDLIRHQKKHCNAGDTDKSMSVSTYNEDDDSNDSLSSMSKDELNLSEDGSLNSYELSGEQDMSTGIKFNCEKCNKSFDKLEAWRDHQNIHMSGNPFSGLATNSAFGVLQNMAAAQQMESDKLKRKYEVFLDDDDHDQPRDKRLRTTILPEQLDYLYQKYQLDCNPSRKQLENISRDVNLKKRVVQVWFQNTRARERKGQYRAHQQLIHKRCPFCRALFRAKSALESHLATKHPEEMAKGDINIDNIPDAALESPSECLSVASTMFTSTPTSADFSKMISPQSMQSFLPILPSPGALPGLPNDPLQMSMTKFYADSFKKYMNELSAPESNEEENTVPLSSPSPVKTHESKPKPSLSSNDDEAPLDLSKPLKVKVENEKISDGPSTDISENSSDNMNMSRHFDDSASDVSMNKSDYYNNSQHAISTSGPSSPVSVTHSSSLSASQASKRYRTQMTSLQVRIMKTIFVDYKTPTMAECEMLGRIIGLQKRVVQVWFQNARAKEKKSKLQMSKTYGTNPDLDFHKPPEECKLCNFKYSHKYTIQDHIFTKKHIEHVRHYVQSQSEAESHLSSQGMAGLTGSLNKQTDRKQWEDPSSQSHLAQLQSMGMGMPLAGLSGLGSSFNPSDILKKDKDNSGDKKSSEGSNKDLMNMDPTQLAAMMSSPFSGFFPGIDPAMLPYMYAGFPGYMPGMGMPFMPPGFMPGAEQLMGGFDPMSFGTPLPLLQIPPQAIKDVSVKLSEPKASVAQYTQDCKSISSLKSLVNNVDYLCVRESTVDVGYICKKCQMVYPGKEACLGHQRTMCFAGGKIPDNISPVLKLEQIQYECKLCSDKSSTVQEYKSHCQSEGHKAKTARIQNKSGKIHSPVSSVPPSPSKTPSSSNPSVSPLPKTDLNSPGFSRPKDNASNAK